MQRIFVIELNSDKIEVYEKNGVYITQNKTEEITLYETYSRLKEFIINKLDAVCRFTDYSHGYPVSYIKEKGKIIIRSSVDKTIPTKTKNIRDELFKQIIQQTIKDAYGRIHSIKLNV